MEHAPVCNVVAFCMGIQLDRGAEEHTYGTLGHRVATEGIHDTSGVTKEPCYAEGARGKNWPGRKKVPRTLILR